MTEITFAISDEWGAGGTGYAPANQRYNAALGAFDLDCPTGTGATPYEAILDLLESNIDQFIEDDRRDSQNKKQMAAECRAEDIAVDEIKCRRNELPKPPTNKENR